MFLTFILIEMLYCDMWASYSILISYFGCGISYKSLDEVFTSNLKVNSQIVYNYCFCTSCFPTIENLSLFYHESKSFTTPHKSISSQDEYFSTEETYQFHCRVQHVNEEADKGAANLSVEIRKTCEGEEICRSWNWTKAKST